MVRKEKQTKPTIADNVDKYELYEESVQCAEAEIDFIEEQFFKLRGRHARSLREDFLRNCKCLQRMDKSR